MSTFALKLIAIITMLIDHIGAVFIPSNTGLYLVFRSIGRLSFPIFCFLIVEGFYHTRNVKKYLIRLGIFAFISEIPFDLAFYNSISSTDINKDFSFIFELISRKQYNSELFNLVSSMFNKMMVHQNVFFTLFLGLLLITLMSKIEKKFGEQRKFKIWAIQGMLTFVFCVIALLLKTDYDYAGILLILAFYLFRGNKIYLAVALFFITEFILGYISYINVLATFAIIPIAFYNGKKGKDIKYLFYIFYPAHLLILYLINTFL